MQDLVDWATHDALLQRVADTSRIYLLGHSRGAKIAALAAAADPRIAAICLIDPVDNTVYASLGPGFPSAADALRGVPRGRPLPVAIVGAALQLTASMYVYRHACARLLNMRLPMSGGTYA